jgi:hypothetical protein
MLERSALPLAGVTAVVIIGWSGFIRPGEPGPTG